MGDDVMGYGKPHPDEQWWLDLEEIDGVIRRADGRAAENRADTGRE
jgi:hypothetical protein